jgi:potassium/chloride transporter 8
MSGDLKNPSRDIPNGTLAAIGLRYYISNHCVLSPFPHLNLYLSFSCFLYTSFILILGSTCVRELLYTNYLIAAKVSALGNVHSFLPLVFLKSNLILLFNHRGPVFCWTVHFIAVE